MTQKTIDNNPILKHSLEFAILVDAYALKDQRK